MTMLIKTKSFCCRPFEPIDSDPYGLGGDASNPAPRGNSFGFTTECNRLNKLPVEGE